jgi:hypothetical protein
MSDPYAQQDPFGLDHVRDRQDYARTLTRLLERGVGERGVAVLSEHEAYVAAELLGQYALLDPTAELNQLAATLASRLYHRLGA